VARSSASEPQSGSPRSPGPADGRRDRSCPLPELARTALARAAAATVRLAFPGGPVTSLDEVPASIRTALTCRCQAEAKHQHLHGPVSEQDH